ncbi:MAG: bifunctional nuclease family protein [bacterium]|nr:MAG: bifunctional nuclease family protein [bacterium]
MIEVVVQGLTIDPNSNNPVLILKEKAGERVMPIWIGLFEANSIAMHLGEVRPPRPMTHDLLNSVVRDTGMSVKRVSVTDLKDNTFYATILLERDQTEVMIDSRPSDAVALAVRSQAPIFIDSSVFEQSAIEIASLEISGDSEKDKWTDLLDKLDPEDFSKYKM